MYLTSFKIILPDILYDVKYMNNLIYAVPDRINQSCNQILETFGDIITARDNNIIDRYDSYVRIYGFSCRSLFLSLISILSDNKECSILVTPLQHTSFYNIINQYFLKDNIFILELNESYDTIINIPDNLKNIDICLITHLFGKDMDISQLYKLKNIQNNCIFIEDRVQGGTFEKKFSDSIIDISLYSSGMDKIPCALGGGICYINYRNKPDSELSELLVNRINSYPVEKMSKRLIFLILKIPTIFIYNSKLFLKFIYNILYILRIDIWKTAQLYRNKNPGFSHDHFLLRPSKYTITSINKSFQHFKNIEYEMKRKTKIFFSYFPEDIIRLYFPWYKQSPLYTNYNTISIEKNSKEFRDMLNELYIMGSFNPTYKIFDGDARNKNFNDSIIYLPSLLSMDKREMKKLANIIKVFYYQYSTNINN